MTAGLNQTPSSERVHIGFFGVRNSGKSSLVNAITGQNLAVVSDVKGTTTDPVKKAMELLPLGPVLIIDTPGFDDDDKELGALRIKKTSEILSTCDVAILVKTAGQELNETERTLIKLFGERPYLIAQNKADLLKNLPVASENEIYVSALTGLNIFELKEKLATLVKNKSDDRKIIADLLQPQELAILVVPVDKAAPKGRLILPQQQTIREILDNHCYALVCQNTELENILKTITPKIVITDSQVFKQVSEIVPENILLTSFSILFARYKGDLNLLIDGAKKLAELKNSDRVLISEGCTHHRQCGDIGTQKIPAMIKKFTNATPEFYFTSGGEFPLNLSDYDLIIHCGGCMLNQQEMTSRLARAKNSNIPIVNYGIAIAHMNGILKSSLKPFNIDL